MNRTSAIVALCGLTLAAISVGAYVHPWIGALTFGAGLYVAELLSPPRRPS